MLVQENQNDLLGKRIDSSDSVFCDYFQKLRRSFLINQSNPPSTCAKATSNMGARPKH